MNRALETVPDEGLFVAGAVLEAPTAGRDADTGRLLSDDADAVLFREEVDEVEAFFTPDPARVVGPLALDDAPSLTGKMTRPKIINIGKLNIF